ncbi:MAG: IMP dehydrogenase [Flammeovirgaceae bacterium]|nr:IMP dehydrogenase [Flammeovirgaceae bacterium]|tara:strand:+ start:25694 stop:27154 length:1461 start_codon:yes stop_codon:yes gene_type:complete
MKKDSKFHLEALTFDDVLLVPSYSEVIPSETNVETKLTKNIDLNIPLVSASMDTVTESQLAISIALKGGIGIVHKNMSIDDQSEEIRKVKRSQSGMIKDPITMDKEASVQDALQIMKKHKIGGIPIINSKEELIGIVTNRDLRFQKDISQKLSEIMTKNIVTAKIGISLDDAEKVLKKHKIEKLPVVDGNKFVGLITYKDIQKNKSMPDACKDHLGRLRVGAALGISDDWEERLNRLIKANADVISIDTAHGHSKSVIELIKKIKSSCDVELIAGNIATGDAAIALVKAGVDAVKVGVGPGSICTTRVIAGVGMPQLSAIYDVAQSLNKSNVPVIADGGIRFSGDIVKALAAGASSVMAGSLFAGTDETPGDIIIYEGRKYKAYRGMGSVEAMEEGTKDRYFQDKEDDPKKLVPEGIVGRVPYKGDISEVIYQLVGGLRAGMGYVGAKNILLLQGAKFVRITNAGSIEGHPHDIFITREAPNYSKK